MQKTLTSSALQKALYFDSALALCDYVRSCGARAGTGSAAKQRIEACRVAHPEVAGESAFVVFGFAKKMFDPAKAVRAHVSPEGDTLTWDFGGIKTTAILDRITAGSLIEVVALTPWSTPEEEANAAQGTILFRVFERQSEIVPALIRDSLRLGNDRIHCAPLQSATAPSEQTAVIIRIERPSWFLLQRLLEEYPSTIELYYPVTEDLYVRWGFSHPFADWWQRSKQARRHEWLFFTGGAGYFHLAPVMWQDVYDIVEVTLNFPHRELWAQSPATLRSFSVPLRLTKHTRESKTEPELWLLNEKGISLLEKSLQIIDDETLRSWQIAIQKLEEGEAKDWVFIRETRSGPTGKKRRHDFGGHPFARYQGLNNLLVPLGWELYPPLRRDAYRSLFRLTPDTMTLLVPLQVINPAGPEGEFRLLNLSERAFDAIGSYVEYIVEREPEKLRDRIEASIFDFAHYLKAPTHAGLAPERDTNEAARKALDALQSFATEGAAANRTSGEEDANALIDRVERPEGPTEQEPENELQREELRIEREITNQGQSLARWCDLLVCKDRLRKQEDALLCAIEALWLAKGASQEEALRRSLVNLARGLAGPNPYEVDLQEAESMRCGAALHIALSKPDPASGRLDRWVAETCAFLRRHDAGLRLKDRWIAWGEVLRVNRDLRQETLLRETIRDAITHGGLRLEETPPFIRTRIFIDRQINTDGTTSSSADVAAHNLEALRKVRKQIKAPRLRRAFRAIFARAFSMLHDFARAQELMEPEPGKDACARAWETLFHLEALREIDPVRAAALEARFDDLIAGADAETTRALRELRESYNDRNRAENPAAFLARENRSRTYPRGPLAQTGKLFELSALLEAHIREGQETGALTVMREMMTLEDKAEYDDTVKLPQFVETLVVGFEHFKWGERCTTLFPLFESFSKRAPGFVSTQSNHFYGSILHSNLALGLLAIDNLANSAKQVRLAADAVCRNTNDLDFIDSAAALIRTVEQLALDQRGPVLVQILESLFTRFDEEASPYLSNERLFVAVAKLLDQIAAAAASKDRLSIRKFREYQLQDEFLILQRIQGESFSENQ